MTKTGEVSETEKYQEKTLNISKSQKLGMKKLRIIMLMFSDRRAKIQI